MLITSTAATPSSSNLNFGNLAKPTNPGCRHAPRRQDRRLTRLAGRHGIAPMSPLLPEMGCRTQEATASLLPTVDEARCRLGIGRVYDLKS